MLSFAVTYLTKMDEISKAIVCAFIDAIYIYIVISVYKECDQDT